MNRLRSIAAGQDKGALRTPPAPAAIPGRDIAAE
jgi:hypothetical protein